MSAHLVAIVALAATRYPFQYAWRFHYGDDPSSPPESGPGTCDFEDDLQDYDLCDGMEHNPNRFSEQDCRLACCYDPNCLVWQAFPIAFGRQCYHGYASANVTCGLSRNSSGMGGGRRYYSPSPAFRTDYAFATAKSNVDADWPVVDAPHDFISENANFVDDIRNFKQGYLPRNASWYRKHFVLPSAWQRDGLLTYIHFEGVFHHATLFLNGHYLLSHECGYTGFTVRIDNTSSLLYGDGHTNILALRADASFGSGHWYEGGGIYRPVHLVRVSPAHIVADGLFVSPQSDGSVVRASAEVELSEAGVGGGGRLAAAASRTIAVRLSLLNGTQLLATNTTAKATIDAGAPAILLAAELHAPAGSVELWSTQSPNLYTVRAEVISTAEESDGLSVEDRAPTVTDSVEKRVGFRTVEWTANGVYLNSERVTLRGFAHHNSIGGLGVAVPERVNLFRVQASRALGANIWRQSHNPYSPHLYSLLDLLGTMCWDENRDYGAKYMGGAYAIAMRDMVKRDRSHPSIIVWSFCNEVECNQMDAAYSADAFRSAALSVDRTRPLTANRHGNAPLSARLDVQGFSHKQNTTFKTFHKWNPDKPAVLSECCSCIQDGNQRMQSDRGLPSCISEENTPMKLPFVAGSLGVWTLMDYFGEPHGTGTSSWPYVSCDFGQFDIAGFPKSHAYWYTSNWLQAVPLSDAGRPPLPQRPVARILDLPPFGDRAILRAIVTAPFSQLYLDGVAQGVRPAAFDKFGAWTVTNWTGAYWFAANATLVALSERGEGARVLATHTVLAPQAASRHVLKLSLDVPSPTTGTGEALILDGRDTALVRASIVDANNGALISSATDRIAWRVVSGPGRMDGVSNGDPRSHEQMKSTQVNAWGGLARGFVKVTEDCVSPGREALAGIDVDSDRSPTRVVANASACDTSTIVVAASSSSLKTDEARISIKVSADAAVDSAFAVAAATAKGMPAGFSYMEGFVG